MNDENSNKNQLVEVAKNQAKKKIVKAVIAKFGIPFLAIFISVSLILGMIAGFFFISESNKTQGDITISDVGKNEIPKEYLQIYYDAEKEYGTPWYILAAVHKIETNFGTIDPMISSAGAVGHMQFMPKTWLGWSYSGNDPPKNVYTDPLEIKKYGGYGVDADGDGKADPFNAKDAIHTASKYLAANGASEGNFEQALFAYNHADWYVKKVLNIADSYKTGGSGSTTAPQATGDYKAVIEEATKYIGYPYVFGGSNPTTSFDCSGLTQWAFRVGAGIELPRTAQQQYEYTQFFTNMSEAKAGDLVYFENTYATSDYITHVGIYLGDGMMFHAGDPLQYSDITTSYYQSIIVGFGRIR